MKDPRIVSSYDALEPSEEAKARMLDNIKAQAQAQGAAAEPRAAVVRYEASEHPLSGLSGAHAAPRRARRWKALGAAAACLVLVAGVGAFALGGFGGSAGFDSATFEGMQEAAQEAGDSSSFDYFADAESEAPASTAQDVLGDVSGTPLADAQTFDTEEYAVIEEHGFTSVASQPFSTFSADVDTASYTNWRRMVNQGMALGDFPGGAIRVEEFLNYFDYDYPLVDCDCLSPFDVSATIADCPWNPDTKLLVLGLRTDELAYADSAIRNNLVFLVDVSGSMDDPDKLGLLKESFAYLVEQLGPEDTVSIVTYSGEERVVLDGVPAAQADRILSAVRELEAGGSTNGQAGLAKAYELAQKHFVEGGNNRIVMASDGDLNVGMTSESELSDYVSAQRELGIYLTVLGFGDGNYSDVRMETLADDGNGNYHYIDCMAEAQRVFGEDLCSTFVTIADDVKLQLEFNPAYVKGYRQVGYENRELAADEFADDRVDAGEVGAGHTVTVAYELVMADSSMDLFTSDSRYGTEQLGVKNGEWFVLNLRWKDPGASESTWTSHTFGEESYTSDPSADWTFAAAVIEYCMLATDSQHVGSATVGSVLEKVDAALAESDDPARREFRSLVSNSAE